MSVSRWFVSSLSSSVPRLARREYQVYGKRSADPDSWPGTTSSAIQRDEQWRSAIKGIAYISAFEIAKKIKAGELTSGEVLEFFLDRFDRCNKDLNIVVAEDRDHARQRADAATEQGEDLGPLHGVPITIKVAYATVRLKYGTNRQHERFRNLIFNLSVPITLADRTAINRWLKHALGKRRLIWVTTHSSALVGK